MRVLVAYASRNGSTTGIAERIAARLVVRGLPVVVRRCDTVDSLADYDAVVFGAPVYDQTWPDEAIGFVSRFRAELAVLPFWLFSVGSFGDASRPLGPLTHKEPRGIEELIEKLQPRDYRVFRGVIRKHQWPLWSRLVFQLFGGRFGDHRDWAAIQSWAEGIAGDLARLPADRPTGSPRGEGRR